MQDLKREYVFKCCDFIRDCISLSEIKDCEQCLEIAVNLLFNEQIIKGSEIMSVEEFMKFGGGDTGFQKDLPKKYKVIIMKSLAIKDKNTALCAMKAISLSSEKALIITGSSLKYSTNKYCILLKEFIKRSNGKIKELPEIKFPDTETEFCIAVVSNGGKPYKWEGELE